MKNKQPPFQITNKMIADVAEISELTGRLSAHDHLSGNPNLRRTNRIRTIHGSLAIEQNTLSLEQVTAVLNGKHVLAPPKDIAEVKNAYEIYERLDELIIIYCGKSGMPLVKRNLIYTAISRARTDARLVGDRTTLDRGIQTQPRIRKSMLVIKTRQAQHGWHEGKEDAVPFIKYLLGTILAAYKDFEDRFALIETKHSALETVRLATQQKIGRFSKQDIRELCPSLSLSSLEGALRKMVASGELRREGNGKNTCYYRLK